VNYGSLAKGCIREGSKIAHMPFDLKHMFFLYRERDHAIEYSLGKTINLLYGVASLPEEKRGVGDLPMGTPVSDCAIVKAGDCISKLIFLARNPYGGKYYIVLCSLE
jgi:hypothetical protein